MKQPVFDMGISLILGGEYPDGLLSDFKKQMAKREELCPVLPVDFRYFAAGFQGIAYGKNYINIIKLFLDAYSCLHRTK